MADRKYIDKLHISNFKYFPSIEGEVKPIKIGGKHLLLYGENGSGKSSIFWSLYTLLECANKPEKSEIQKYFKYNNKQNLLNINAPQLAAPDDEKVDNAFVKISLKDDATDYYEISYDNLGINDENEAKVSNYASDFINYKFLYSAFNFRHRNRVDLYNHFSYNIFPYIKLGTCKIWKINPLTSLWEDIDTDNASEVIDFILKGPSHTKLPDERKVYRIKAENKREVKNRIEKALIELKKWETHINTRGNEILKELGYNNITFNLKFEQKKKFHLTERNYTPPEIKLWLTIPEYEGKEGKVHRLHSFLNEAKLTAISLAMRFAVLEKRTTDAEVKILVLDDLMISLDMNNRHKVVDFILKNYLENFQIFFLTHDKNLFNFVKLKINEWDKKSNWEIKEMYSSDDNKPVILEKGLELIDRANTYFKAYDYYSAGNNIRKAIEEKLKHLLPETIRITSKDLNNEMHQLFDYYDSLSFGELINDELRNNLLNFKDIVFNPASHFDLRSPLYKIEMEKAFEIYNILVDIPKIERKLLVGMRANLFYANPAENYNIQFILKENLYASRIVGQQYTISNPKNYIVTYSKNGIDFLNKATALPYSDEFIARLKRTDEKILTRISQINNYLDNGNPVEVKEFTLLNGTSLENLINELDA